MLPLALIPPPSPPAFSLPFHFGVPPSLIRLACSYCKPWTLLAKVDNVQRTISTTSIWSCRPSQIFRTFSITSCACSSAQHRSNGVGGTSCLQAVTTRRAAGFFGGVFAFLPTGYMLSSRDRDCSINPQSVYAPAAHSAAAEISIKALAFRRMSHAHGTLHLLSVSKLSLTSPVNSTPSASPSRSHRRAAPARQIRFHFSRSRERGFTFLLRRANLIFRVPTNRVISPCVHVYTCLIGTCKF
ncbi:hypothetical protein C8R43DRAFT_1106646 [Mycena crocata]|nr:hypothetical protein C8R43DRAFT_1106646 [Mycena crocata]